MIVSAYDEADRLPATLAALGDAFPGARLVVLEGVGHELPAAAWDVFVPALVAATGG